MVIQRNVLIILLFIAIVVIALSIIFLRFIKNSQTIDSFIVEIDERNSVPTLITEGTLDTYTSTESMKRYFIMKYINAREGYIYSLFMENYKNVVRVLSSQNVYYRDYRAKYSPYNADSPYAKYGANYSRDVELKSIIFRNDTSAQVRIRVNDSALGKLDKIIYMEFQFANLQLTRDERFINPLGFQVTLYRIEDEKA